MSKVGLELTFLKPGISHRESIGNYALDYADDCDKVHDALKFAGLSDAIGRVYYDTPAIEVTTLPMSYPDTMEVLPRILNLLGKKGYRTCNKWTTGGNCHVNLDPLHPALDFEVQGQGAEYMQWAFAHPFSTYNLSGGLGVVGVQDRGNRVEFRFFHMRRSAYLHKLQIEAAIAWRAFAMGGGVLPAMEDSDKLDKNRAIRMYRTGIKMLGLDPAAYSIFETAIHWRYAAAFRWGSQAYLQLSRTGYNEVREGLYTEAPIQPWPRPEPSVRVHQWAAYYNGA